MKVVCSNRACPIVFNQMHLHSASGVHSNSLNRALKQHTGQTTSQLLNARLLQEAWALLRHTDWPISSISSCLGFSEPTHFAAFCRRLTGYSPSQVRQVWLASEVG